MCDLMKSSTWLWRFVSLFIVLCSLVWRVVTVRLCPCSEGAGWRVRRILPGQGFAGGRFWLGQVLHCWIARWLELVGYTVVGLYTVQAVWQRCSAGVDGISGRGNATGPRLRLL